MKTDWSKAVQPLIKKYGKRKHPLEFKNTYQMLIMVILAARDTDKNINIVAPDLFKAFPSMKELSKAEPDDLYPLLKRVRGFVKKTDWLVNLSREIKTDDNIPLTMEELVKLPGVGRKTANVILHETGNKPEGVIVDLHVLRVAQRLGIAKGDDPKKIEEQLMKSIDQKYWGKAGMSLSFLGREVCRPTDPHHSECVMNYVCSYFKKLKSTTKS